MADIVLNLQNIIGATIVMTVDEDQKLPVAHFTDASGEKRAGDLVVDDCVYHANTAFTVVDPPA